MGFIRKCCNLTRDVVNAVPYNAGSNHVVGAGVPTARKGCANRDVEDAVPYKPDFGIQNAKKERSGERSFFIRLRGAVFLALFV